MSAESFIILWSYDQEKKITKELNFRNKILSKEIILWLSGKKAVIYEYESESFIGKP